MRIFLKSVGAQLIWGSVSAILQVPIFHTIVISIGIGLYLAGEEFFRKDPK